MKSGFKRTINWNRYQSKVIVERQSRFLDFLINPSFQEINKRFVLSFEDNADRTGHTNYFLPAVEKKYYNFIINEQNFFHRSVRHDMRTNEIFERLQLDKEMIKQLAGCYIIPISKNIIRSQQ